MKTFKKVCIIILLLLVTAILALRIIKVVNDESITTKFANLEEGQRFVAGAYYPVTESLIINDSISFLAGKILVQDEVKLKHHFFILSSYFEKSPTNNKYLYYKADGKPNKSNLILHVNRNDSTLYTIIYRNKQDRQDSDMLFESYELHTDYLMDTNNRKYPVENFAELDTIKFYLKEALISYSDTDDFNKYEVSLKKEPVDSILFIKHK